MQSRISPFAGQLAPEELLLDVAKLIDSYYALKPDPSVATQRVSFGTSGHRGSAFTSSFNEQHVLAISQAICSYRQANGMDGPLFLGIDTHALSLPALETALTVFAGNGATVLQAKPGEYTPTPALSHAILKYNRGRTAGFADGVVLTPSHNPPESGGYKYNLSNGGPADSTATGWIESEANRLLASGLAGLRRVSHAQALQAPTIRSYDFLENYVAELGEVIDFEVIRGSGIRIGVDPLGGAGVHYWPRIAERYQLNLQVVNQQVDPTFRFMSLDWDGRIRLDPSSSYAMQSLIGLKEKYDIAFGCDTDHDRHGIVTPSGGLLPPNHFLSVMIDYLFRNRPRWRADLAIGKTVVSSALIDRVAKRLGRRLYEVPAGFKWFAAGLFDGALGFAGEESAGASFLRRDGGTWTTDKDGITPALLAAEITAHSGKDPAHYYQKLSAELGEPFADRLEASATLTQKRQLSKLVPAQIHATELAGEPLSQVSDRAPGNAMSIGGIKLSCANGWFAARPSGTEDLYKIYAESFVSPAHLQKILVQAQQIVDGVFAAE